MNINLYYLKEIVFNVGAKDFSPLHQKRQQ
jgi:hypothetical protein